MAPTNRGANLRVRISADMEDIKKGLALLRGDLAKVKTDAAKAAPDANAWQSSIGRIRGELVRLAGVYVGIQGISRGIGALFRALDRADELDKLSQSAGVSAEAFARLAFAARLSGADVSSLSRGLLKLSEDATKNKGVLDALGIEIDDAAGNARSAEALLLDLADVFEALPDGAEKTALAMKLLGQRAGPGLIPLLNEGRQGLIDLGIEAERTGNVMSAAGVKGAVELADNLDRLKLTATGLANETAQRLIPAFAGYVAAAAGAGQQSNVAAEGGEFLSNAIKGMAAPVILVKNLLEGLLTVLLFLGDGAVKVGQLISSHFVRTVGGLGEVLRRVADGQSAVVASFNVFRDVGRTTGEEAKETLAGIRNGFSAMKDGLAESGRDIVAIGKLFSEADAAVAASGKGVGKTGDAAEKAALQSEKLLALVRSILGGGGAGGADGASPTEKKIKGIAASTVLLQDAVTRAQEALDQQFEDGAITAATYYGQRVALQQQLIDLQIAQLQSELALTTELDRRRRIEEQITILQRDRAQVGTDAAREQRKAEAELNAERLAGLRTRASGLTGGLSAQEQSISAQVDAGSLGYLEGERRLREIRAQSLAQLRDLRAEQAAYLASLAPGDPNMAAAQEGLLGIDTAIANVTASMKEMRQDTLDIGANALTGFFTSLRDGAVSAGDAFRELVADFSRGIYDMLAQATARRLVGAIAGLFGGAGGAGEQDVQQGAVALTGAAAATTIAGGAISAGATQLSISASQLTAAAAALAAANAAGGGGFFGLAHGGGVAGALRMSRGGIDPMIFGAAPRYHGGGIAGLEGNEIPAILQRGEIIRTREQESALQARMNAGQAAPPVVRNVIVFDEAELANALAGSAGERMVINHVRNNRRAVSGGA